MFIYNTPPILHPTPSAATFPYLITLCTKYLIMAHELFKDKCFVPNTQLLSCSCAINHLSPLIHANVMLLLFGKHLGPM